MKRSVENKIKEIIASMGVSYLFESWHGANRIIDKMERTKTITYPVCINVLPQRGELTWKNSGQVTDAPNCVLGFGDTIRLDFTAEEVQEVVERMKHLAMVFIERINNSDLFEPVDTPVFYTCMFDKLDQNLAIVTIELVLKERQGVCVSNLID